MQQKCVLDRTFATAESNSGKNICEIALIIHKYYENDAGLKDLVEPVDLRFHVLRDTSKVSCQ